MNTKIRYPLIALLLAAIMLLAGCSSAVQPQTNTSVDESQTTTYVSTDLEQCKLIKYMCVQGKEPFTDANGCGCKPTSQVQFPDGQTEDVFYVATNVTVCAATTFLCDADKQMFFNESGCGCKTPTANDEPKKTYCTPEQKNATICTMEYRQVCGWMNENVKCIKFPCAVEAASPCTACATENVDYYTEGACPSDITQTMPAKTSSELMEPINPNKACTMDYTPVCALFDDGKSVTIGNACGASNIKGVVSTKAGECAQPIEPKRVVMACDQSYVDQQEAGTAMCTKEYMPVCGNDAADAQVTYGNKCMACTTPGVFEYTEGACNDGTGATI